MTERSKEDDWLRELASMRPALDRRFRMLRGSGRGPDLATSDVVQATIARFMSYARGMPRLEFEHARRLLLRVLRHTALDAFRRVRLRRRILGGDGAQPLAQTQACSRPDAADAAAEAEERQRLESVLASLSDAERELVRLRRTHATWREVAAQLGVSEEAARRRWSDLVRRLRDRQGQRR